MRRQRAGGEAREADLGVASGNGKGQIFVKGEVIKTVMEDEIVDTWSPRRRASRQRWAMAPSLARRPWL